MTSLATILSAALLQFLWQGAIVAAALAVVLGVLRHRSARARYAAGCTALAIVAAAPIATLFVLSSLNAVSPEPSAPLSAVPPRVVVGIPETMLPIWIEPAKPQLLWLTWLQAWALPIWSLGVLVLSIRLALSAMHVFRIGRRGTPADETVEAIAASAVRRLDVTRPIRIVMSAATEVPSVIGWMRPIVLLPLGVTLNLTPAQLEAVIAHELAHVARHDYLVNIAQAVVETIFFYHPAAWWISKQLRIERELCCDDLAVQASGDAVGYARALASLERIRQPRVALAASGGPLLYRIQRLLDTPAEAQKPSRVAGLLVLGVGVACVLMNVNWARLSAQSEEIPTLAFEVASIKPSALEPGHISLDQKGSQYFASGVTLKRLLRLAYQLQDDQIFGGPSWFDTARFDIIGKMPDPPADEPPLPQGITRRQLMLRSLLADRFGLRVHKEVRELPVYTLSVARKDGSLGRGLTRVADPDCVGGRSKSGAPPSGGVFKASCGTSMSPGLVRGNEITMATLATALSSLTYTGMSLGRPVVDKTGLSGPYNVELRFTPDTMPNFGPGGPPPDMPTIDANGPSLFTAVQEQLGLKLQSAKGPVEVLVVDDAQMPSTN